MSVTLLFLNSHLFEAFQPDGSEETELLGLSLEALKAKAQESSNDEEPKVSTRTVNNRSVAIKAYALKRANGFCEGCNQPSPFMGKHGHPFLEVHHVHRLSDGGPDAPDAIVAICPNCHRRAHYAVDAQEFNQKLTQIAQMKGR